MRSPVFRLLICLALVLLCASCGSSDPEASQDPSISGAWGLQTVDGQSGIRTYVRLDALAGDQDGYRFDADGALLVRDAGWCGTPPLTYANREGSWVADQEDVLVLTYSHWDGMRDFRLEILSLDGDHLRCVIDPVE